MILWTREQRTDIMINDVSKVKKSETVPSSSSLQPVMLWISGGHRHTLQLGIENQGLHPVVQSFKGYYGSRDLRGLMSGGRVGYS